MILFPNRKQNEYECGFFKYLFLLLLAFCSIDWLHIRIMIMISSSIHFIQNYYYYHYHILYEYDKENYPHKLSSSINFICLWYDGGVMMVCNDAVIANVVSISVQCSSVE